MYCEVHLWTSIASSAANSAAACYQIGIDPEKIGETFESTVKGPMPGSGSISLSATSSSCTAFSHNR